MAAVTGVIAVLDQHTQSASLVVLYLLAVLPVAVHWGAPFGALVSVLSTATFDFFFVAPRNSFTPGDSGAWLDLGVFVVAALVVSELAGRSRRQAHASARLAEEQAALRRVATLVARAVPPSEVFETVTREIGLLSDADFARMERYEDDGTVTGVAAWTRHDDPRLAVGTRFVLSGVSIAARVRDTRGAVRVDSFTGASGPIAEECLFAQDTGTKSTCSGECAVDWPPVRVSGKPKAGSGVNTSMLGTTPRSDGKPQVTYNGHPLYLFEGDSNAGDTYGQAITAFGAAWYVMSPAGNAITTESASAAGGGRGY